MNELCINERIYRISELKLGDKNFPKRLQSIKRGPKKIYVTGNMNLLNKFSIAIVGSRKATKYGIEKAKEISNSLSEYGITIISGMAIGIDYYAHVGSMKEKGNTIAVLR